MSRKILVTYASRTGSTADIAEYIGEILSDHGAQVEIRLMHDVKDLTHYDAVVCGSAIQSAGWLPEAMQFLETHKSNLNLKPIAIFSVCMTLAMKNGEKYKQSISNWINPIRKIVNPASEEIFAGTLKINQIPSFVQRLKFRISVALGVWKEGDHRNWDAIKAWTTSLKSVFQL